MGWKTDVNPGTPRWDKYLERRGLLKYQAGNLSDADVTERYARVGLGPDWASLGREPGGRPSGPPLPSAGNWSEQVKIPNPTVGANVAGPVPKTVMPTTPGTAKPPAPWQGLEGNSGPANWTFLTPAWVEPSPSWYNASGHLRPDYAAGALLFGAVWRGPDNSIYRVIPDESSGGYLGVNTITHRWVEIDHAGNIRYK
jgi:hypothetical protein